MLFTTRNIGQAISFDDGRIQVILISTRGEQARFGIIASDDVKFDKPIKAKFTWPKEITEKRRKKE